MLDWKYKHTELKDGEYIDEETGNTLVARNNELIEKSYIEEQKEIERNKKYG
jgi:hypothetical protein